MKKKGIKPNTQIIRPYKEKLYKDYKLNIFFRKKERLLALNPPVGSFVYELYSFLINN